MLDESKYIFNLVKSCAAKGKNGRIYFHYHLGPVPICRDAFCVALGLSCASSRVKKYETAIRKGDDIFVVQGKRHARRGTSMQELAQCFIMTFVMINSEKSPTDKIVLLEPQSLPEVYLEYKKYFSEINCCKQSTFEKLWYQQIRLPLPDPVANVFYTIKRRKRAKCGFKRCDTCCELQFNIYAAKGTTAKQEARDAYQAHVDSYTADRRELGRIRSICNGKNIVGFSIDAADKNKFATPTVKCRAKMLAGMYVIKNKITGVEFFSGDRKLLLFHSLPDVTTGANMTLTLLARVFNLGYLDQAEVCYINWDGSHDNVNYTCVYGLIHFLLCAEKTGWPLRKFVVLRLQVGHTHILLDAAWAIISVLLYGCHGRGDARRDMLDFKALEDLCRLGFRRRLKHYEQLRGCFDFDAFLKPYRPSSADESTFAFGLGFRVRVS